MDYSQYIKKLDLPSNFEAPTKLAYEDLIARPLTRKDLLVDMQGVNSSIELIHKTRGGSWPQEAVTEDFNLLDLSWHEAEFRDHQSFAYVIYDNNGLYIGCFYLYPMGFRTELSEETIDYDIDASWWVTTKAYENGYYKKLQTALKQWLADEFPFDKVYYSNKEK
jgi:hypothetical protein